MFLPECTSDARLILPCRSVVREVLLHACKHELSDILFYTSLSGVDVDFLVNYISTNFPAKQPCFNVSVTCDVPPVIPHSTNNILTEVKSSYPVNTSITYTCDQNYKMDGKVTTFCKYSGEWEPLPKCILNSVDEKIQIIIASVFQKWSRE